MNPVAMKARPSNPNQGLSMPVCGSTSVGGLITCGSTETDGGVGGSFGAIVVEASAGGGAGVVVVGGTVVVVASAVVVGAAVVVVACSVVVVVGLVVVVTSDVVVGAGVVVDPGGLVVVLCGGLVVDVGDGRCASSSRGSAPYARVVEASMRIPVSGLVKFFV